ncbi:cytidine deaminase [Rothia kristinae]|uniref:cytidine deaminase n=1 Tax=Rothia kristinae TaxID=37923 RepID=UPI001CD3204B|nr:cytidine deaminase [Rothia kristinae]MCA1170348.1 cytidine deaminase [Rothia kristinae]
MADSEQPGRVGQDAVAGTEVGACVGDDPAWPELLTAARDCLERAYCPYSGFPVGAAARTEDGRLVTGANIENAAYGVTLCAECSLVSELFRTGGGRLVRFACVDRTGTPIMPCGRCRQLLSEHAAPGLVVLTPQGELPMAEVLPQAFGPGNLGS